MTILYTGGTFDLLHPGHLEFLRHCKEASDKVVVGLNTDEFCRQYKRPPVMTYEERKACLLACRYVDDVVPNTGGYNSKPAIMQVKPDFIAHGDDWTGPEYLKQLDITEGWLMEHCIKLVYFPYTKGVSTTDIIQRIKDR